MIIKTQFGDELVNFDKVEVVTVEEATIYAYFHYSDDIDHENYIMLGTYNGLEEAARELDNIYTAVKSGAKVYTMSKRSD